MKKSIRSLQKDRERAKRHGEWHDCNTPMGKRPSSAGVRFSGYYDHRLRGDIYEIDWTRENLHR